MELDNDTYVYRVINNKHISPLKGTAYRCAKSGELLVGPDLFRLFLVFSRTQGRTKPQIKPKD